ncbi:MAG: D-alanyl-D-alanine carboxypeptidase/D-alanyl-D-alanine-endopeptidase [Acidobacteriota bacterium]
MKRRRDRGTGCGARAAALVAAGLVAAVPAGPAEAGTPPAVAQEVSRIEAGGGTVGLLAQDLDGRVLFAHAPDRPLVPASTMKLLTTACALERLGPAWTVATEVLADGRLDPSGHLRGTLWIRGGGDPLLRVEDLWALTRELHALGLRRVEGLGVDPGLFTGPPVPASWPGRPVRDPYAAPQGAASLAWNSLELVVRPGARPGAPAEVALFPFPGGVRIVNRARTGGTTELDIRLNTAKDRPAQVTIGGTIAAGAAPYREWIRLGDPARALLGVFRGLLGQAGITVAGQDRIGPVPAGARSVTRRLGRPLAEIVRAVNKYSSNFGAEVLLRHLGALRDPPQRSTAAGLSVLGDCLQAWGVARRGLVLADGSGYAPADRLTARALVTVLEHAARDPRWGPELVVSLPRAGEDGSLRNRLADLRGTVRAKTGSLARVATLAGLLARPGRPAVAFAILVNGQRRIPRESADRLLRALARDLESGRLPASSGSRRPERGVAVGDAPDAPR